MSDQDLFNDTQTNNDTTPSATPKTPDDIFNDKLSAIKNENGEPKYKDVETALDALQASQEFIERLKAEKAEESKKSQELQAELERRSNIEDFVNRVAPPQTIPQSQEKPATPEPQESLSEDKITEILERRLQQRTMEEKRTSNLSQVISDLSEKFGDQASAKIKQKATEVGTTPARLKELAQENPNMVLALFGTGTTVSDSPSKSTVTSTAPRTEDKPMSFEKGRSPVSGGLTTKELTDFFKQSKSQTNKRLNIEG